MGRKWLLSLLCLSAAITFAQLSTATSTLRVNEPTTTFLVDHQVAVAIEVVNPTRQRVDVRLKLDLLDTSDVTRGLANRIQNLEPGANRLRVPLTLTPAKLNDDNDKSLPWYRLRYQIEPLPDTISPLNGTSGLISLSEIKTPNIFALEVTAPQNTGRGMRYFAHVRAFHPVTNKPVKGVAINARLDFDEPQNNRHSSLTDLDGNALVDLKTPLHVSDTDGEILVVARLGGFVQEIRNDVDVSDNARIMITTDKTIYQPGQPLHVRALIFAANRAAADAEATLTIEDPDGTTVFKADLRTSRFGVANADWTLPDNTRLGSYLLKVEMDDENLGESSAAQQIKVSRYDLPNFAVTVKPDRTYYLPGQQASVEVNADYLFGQPVKNGHVKIVRETERSWNFREQKWTVEEAESYEGDADKDGRFKVALDLTKDHLELSSRDYQRFTDLTYGAYFTDPTTNRTEQRRFDLRLTKDAIHVYVSEGEYRQARELPLVFFVSTAYADGTPASCDVAISEAVEEGQSSSKRVSPLRIIRTNKYGVAKVSGLMATVHQSGKASLALSAQDNSGQRGRHIEDFYYNDKVVLRVETDKTLYQQGEPLEVSITSNVPVTGTLVNVAAQGHIIQSKLVQLKNGMARLMVPHRPSMKDSVQVFVFHRSGPDYEDSAYGSRTVLFPRERDLKFDVRLDNSTYRPGDDALAKFQIVRADGRPATSVLGVTIFDKAVEERARTDQEFGGQFGFSGAFNEWRGYNASVGGLTARDLERLDLKKHVSSDLETVAQMLLASSRAPELFFEESAFKTDHRDVFSEFNKLQIAPLLKALNSEYATHNVYPMTASDLRRLFFEGGLDFSGTKDPWGNPYRDDFSFEADKAVLQFVSAGPDKKFDTKDDFSAMRLDRPYFKFIGEAINRTVRNFHARTGGFIRDAATLKRELEQGAVNFDVIRDPWDQPYHLEFTTTQKNFNILVTSAGPDKTFTHSADVSDDFIVWQSSIDYTGELKAVFEKTLREHFGKRKAIPRDDKELNAALDEFAVPERLLTDAWGHNYYGEYGRQFRHSNQVNIQSHASYGTDSKFAKQVIPVFHQVDTISLRSKGEDGKQSTADDFEVASFSQITNEGAFDRQTGKPISQPVTFSGAKGAITGTVTDPAGGSVSGAKVQAVSTDGSKSFETETDDNGYFILQNIPTGFYEVRCGAPGFTDSVVAAVPVRSANVTTVNLMLDVGTVSSVVEVTATDAAQINTTNTTISSMLRPKDQIIVGNQISTPRLREYFPETLLWQPSLETDTSGRAQLKFKLADNITTWKMSLIASTEDGDIGTTETEFKAFQPFFAEHEPPRVLTEGDQISLPVVLRNYLEKNQTVNVEMKPEQWFSFVGPSQQKVDMAAGESAREIFNFRASASVKNGKQRVTVTGTEASDAIEKPVSVHPDGQEITQTVGDVLVETSSMNINIPESAIPGSIEAEMKLYPNLFSHVAESIEGIMERPYGCGEQTISSTYPSLLFLAHNRAVRQDQRTVAKAQRYVKLGHQRLLNYREENGGFSYWGKGDANIALTAYALRFLNDVRPFVDTDAQILIAARQWLIKQQNPEGNWGDKGPNGALLTAEIARMLAITAPAPDPTVTKGAVKQRSPELERALSYLRTRIETSDEPYLIASYALTAMEAGDLQDAGRAVTKLRSMARTEGGASYWALETSTPFHGWGLAGRLETTAIALEALVRSARTGTKSSNASGAADPLIRSGLLFLLKKKDRYGVWHSTQSTVKVLQTLVSVISSDSVNSTGAFAPIEMFVNGRPVKSIQLPPGNESVLIRENVSELLRPGDNRVDLKRAAGFSSISVQVVTNYYMPWSSLVQAQDVQKKKDQVLLTVSFDKTDAMVNEEIACSGKIERIGRGYGMMLAEIGLPPGAEVDRASLEAALKTSYSEISQYDVLPDRVVLYAWPYDGRAEFTFKFRPRFAMNAKTAASTLIDYYNPEAVAQIAPTRFVIK